jgi:hypothetical protein
MKSFQSRTCLKKDVSVLFTKWPEANSFIIFSTTRRPENNQNHRMPKRMVVGVCWQAWQNYCGSSGSKMRSADEETL